jgi:low affinity Fe/Cu permease
MGVAIAIVLVVAAILAVNKIGDWFDAKTGWVLGAILAGAATTFLMVSLLQANKDSVRPRPIPVCQQAGTC